MASPLDRQTQGTENLTTLADSFPRTVEGMRIFQESSVKAILAEVTNLGRLDLREITQEEIDFLIKLKDSVQALRVDVNTQLQDGGNRILHNSWSGICTKLLSLINGALKKRPGESQEDEVTEQIVREPITPFVQTEEPLDPAGASTPEKPTTIVASLRAWIARAVAKVFSSRN